MEINSTPSKLLLVAAVALIDADNRVLLSKRPEGKELAGLWEFPGGKVELGETPEAALKRELFEELDIIIEERDLVPINFSSYNYQKFHLLMPLWGLRHWKNVPISKEGQEIAWVHADRLQDFDVPPADEFLIEFLQEYLKVSQ